MISPLRIALMRIAALPDVRGEISAQARLTSVHRTDRTQTSCGFAKMEQRTRSIRPIATFNMISLRLRTRRSAFARFDSSTLVRK